MDIDVALMYLYNGLDNPKLNVIKSIRLRWGRKGVAIRLSPEMEAFVNKAVEVIEANNGNWKPEDVVLEGVVNSLKYGSRSVMIAISPESSENWGARARATEEIALIEIQESNGVVRRPLYYLTHEIIHCFDPKTSTVRLRDNTPWGSLRKPRDPDNRPEEYHNAPEEQDAEMTAISREIINWLWNKFRDKNKMLIALKNPSFWLHFRSREESWSKNPKIWRKFLRTLYATAERFLESFDDETQNPAVRKVNLVRRPLEKPAE